MHLLALSIKVPFPWEFILLFCITAAAIPALWTWRKNISWRIHIGVAAILIVPAAQFAARHVETRQNIERSFTAWDSGYFDIDRPKTGLIEFDKIPVRPAGYYLSELFSFAVIPGAIVFLISLRICRRLPNRPKDVSVILQRVEQAVLRLRA